MILTAGHIWSFDAHLECGSSVRGSLAATGTTVESLESAIRAKMAIANVEISKIAIRLLRGRFPLSLTDSCAIAMTVVPSADIDTGAIGVFATRPAPANSLGAYILDAANESRPATNRAGAGDWYPYQSTVGIPGSRWTVIVPSSIVEGGPASPLGAAPGLAGGLTRSADTIVADSQTPENAGHTAGGVRADDYANRAAEAARGAGEAAADVARQAYEASPLGRVFRSLENPVVVTALVAVAGVALAGLAVYVIHSAKGVVA